MSPEDHRSGFDRRKLLAMGGTAGVGAAALLGAGYTGYRLADDDGAADTASEDVEAATEVEVDEAASFRTQPDLVTPPVEITRYGTNDGQESGGRFIFLGPYKFRNNNPPPIGRGPMIIDRSGELVWFKPGGGGNEFRVQTYQGNQVLTWWQGGSGGGYGLGECVIFDSSYQQIATVRAVGKGLKADLHEFQLTDRGTAYLTVYRESQQDLSDIGGHRKGKLVSGLVQEVDVATGELVFEWDSINEVAPGMSYRSPGKGRDSVFDYFHINSIYEVDDDTLLISARNTWAIYLISKQAGKIIWTLGGRQSDFEQTEAEKFYWQHDATMIGPNRVLLFDNASAPQQGPESRAMVVQLDQRAGTAELIKEYTHPSKLLANFLGNVQQLPSGDLFVGWGTEPYFSQFAASGKLKMDGRLPENVMNYRITTHDWEGHPTDDPQIAIGTNKAAGVMVYASWNGATEVAKWKVFAGEKAADLKLQATVDRSGFETRIPVISEGPFFRAVAMDRSGKKLGQSKVIKSAS